jgi:hypothetical protein
MWKKTCEFWQYGLKDNCNQSENSFEVWVGVKSGVWTYPCRDKRRGLRIGLEVGGYLTRQVLGISGTVVSSEGLLSRRVGQATKRPLYSNPFSMIRGSHGHGLNPKEEIKKFRNTPITLNPWNFLNKLTTLKIA